MSSENRLDQVPEQAAAGGGSGDGGNRGRFRKGQSGNSAGRPRKDSADTGGVVGGAMRMFRSDGWTSLLSGLGTLSRDKREATYFQPDLIDWDTALNIYRGDPLAARIIETKPNELVREGYDLCITDEEDEDDEDDEDLRPEDDQTDTVGVLKSGKVEREVLAQRRLFGGRKTDALDRVGKELQEEVENKWEELELLPTLHEALCYEAAYGGAAILIGANDGATSLEQPLVVKRVRSVDFLTALEPREIVPVAWYGDPRAPKYGRPAIYQLTPSVPGVTVDKKIHAQTVRIHESRLIVFGGVRVTRRNLSQLGGWGDSILTRVYRVLRDFNLSWGAAGILVADFAQAVYKMKGLNELLQEDPKDLFKQRMLGMELSRSVARAVMIDSEDEFERKQTPVSGLPDLLDRFATQLAAAADLPLPLLMGESPGGLNASGASGDQLRMFYDRVASTAKRKVVPAIRRITSCIFQALGGEPETWTIRPRPLWQLTEKEQAEARKIQADTDAIYLDRGVVEGDEVRDSRFGGDSYSYETSLKDRDASEPSAEAMEMYAAEQSGKAMCTACGRMGEPGQPCPSGQPLCPPIPAAAAPAEPPKPVEGGIAPKPGAAAPSSAPAGTPAPTVAPGREIQKEVMNGAQISSLLEVIKAAGNKEISRESAGAVLRLAFQINPNDATELLGPETFKPEKPADPFGGGGGAFGGAPGEKPPAPGEKPPAPGEKPPAPGEKKPNPTDPEMAEKMKPPTEKKPEPKLEEK